MRSIWFVVVSLLLSSSAGSQEVVSDEPLAKSELLAALPVFAVRKVPVDDVITERDAPGIWSIDPSVVSAAADQQRKFNTADNPEDAAGMKAIRGWEDQFVGKTGFIKTDRYSFHSQSDVDKKARLKSMLQYSANKSAVKAIPMPLSGKTSPRFEYVDPDGIGYIIAANKHVKGDYGRGDSSKPDFSLDERFAVNLRNAYRPVKAIGSNTSDAQKISAVSDGIQEAVSNLPVAASLLINAGDAGIGTPLVFTAEEKHLKVEPSILKKFDIYWLQLAINPSEELVERSLELQYDIKIESSGCLVMGIVPLRLGQEINVIDKGAVPSVKMGDLEIGEMFSRTVEYKYIRPTILGHGIQTASFGWIFRDDALDQSAKRLFAVLAVPRGIKQINTTMRIATKFKGYFGMNLASEWGSTGQTLFPILLSR